MKKMNKLKILLYVWAILLTMCVITDAAFINGAFIFITFIYIIYGASCICNNRMNDKELTFFNKLHDLI